MKKTGNQNFTISLEFDQSPKEVFDAINNVRGWWSADIQGDTDKLGAEFAYHYKDIHFSKQRITELVPNSKVVWHVLEAQLNFVKDKDEWNGTEIVFDITKKGDKTELHFTHVGLVPEFECYSACNEGWNIYIKGSLKDLITEGKGNPNIGEAITDSEKALSKLTLERTFSAPIEKVWEAFTDVDELKKWWTPPGMETPHISLDLKKGGVFRYCFRDPDGKEFWGRGIYQTIEKPRFLSFLDTFTDAKGDPVPSSHYGMPGTEIVESLVEFSLTENGGVTLMKMVGENPYDDSMLEDMTKGWSGMFDKLEILLKD